MGALAEGVKGAGGRVVGCTLDWFDGTRSPSPHLDEVVPSPSLAARIERLLEGTSAAVALPGGVGTLSEVFWLWTLLMHGKGMNRRLILMGEPWRDLLDTLSRSFEVDATIRAIVHLAATAEQAADLACGEPT
jgi:predicted Rossmann-fold nucleotide-binding protein